MSIFQGCGTAIVTPFRNGEVDFNALGRLIDFQIAEGIDAIVACGSTGEGATLSPAEKKAVIAFMVQCAAGRVPVIAGTGGNDTAAVIAQSIAAQNAGADALLVVTPYYNKTSQRGLVAHYAAVAATVTIPIIIYNVPSRTGLNVLPATMRELMQIPNVVGTKEASGNIEQIVNLAALCPDCELYAGNDDHVLPILSVGGKGVISTVSNLIPRDMHQLCTAFFAGDIEKARALQFKILPIWKAAFSDVNPIPLKAMMEMAGHCTGELRLPLIPADAANMAKIKAALQNYDLILGA
ncbi:MAG: 4-hydroxy-tetrahydrodipicolinate synthase [Clostridiales bacterium]|nr:4-hydroxy-tetrahydrodipicolinate synthase [Clostridiales bacterium]